MAAMTLNVRVSGPLATHVADMVGPDGRYENVSEYVRDLIRREIERKNSADFDELKAELKRAFATADEAYTDWDVDAFIADVRSKAA